MQSPVTLDRQAWPAIRVVTGPELVLTVWPGNSAGGALDGFSAE